MRQKTTIILPERLHQRVKELAAAKKKSMGAFIRETLEEKAAQTQPRPKSIGMGASGEADIARRIDELYEPDPWR